MVFDLHIFLDSTVPGEEGMTTKAPFDPWTAPQLELRLSTRALFLDLELCGLAKYAHYWRPPVVCIAPSPGQHWFTVERGT